MSLVTRPLQTVTEWKGKDIEQMTAEELRQALKECWQMYLDKRTTSLDQYWPKPRAFDAIPLNANT